MNPVTVSPIPKTYLDTDSTMAADSDLKVPTQKAVKAYVASSAPAPTVATGAEVDTGTEDAKMVTPKALADAGVPNGKQIATPANPASGRNKLYFKNDDGLYILNSAGVESGFPTTASSTTFTNKRIEPRIVSATSYTTDTGTALSVATCDEFVVTAQAGALKFNNPGGTPVQGEKLIIRVKDDGTARALTYDTQFRASSDLALPTTTVLGKVLYMGFIYNATDTKWDLLAVLSNF